METCGSRLTTGTGKGGQYAYYTCDGELILQEALDEIVFDALLDRVRGPQG